MTRWARLTLGDVLELKRGYDLPAAKREPGSVPIISSSGPTDFHSEAKVHGPGVITGRYGTIGEVFFTRDDFWPLNTALYVHDFKDNDPHFCYYLLKTLDWNKFNDKSGVPGVNRNDAHQEPVVVPPLAEQHEIASVLGAVDEKIDLNRRTAATLEQMARALYRSWFVDFDPVKAKAEGLAPAFMDEATAALFPDRFGEDGLPEGWSIESIYQIAKVQYGAAFKSNLFNTGKVGRPLVRIRDLKNQQAGVFTTENHNKEYLIQPGDTVVGMDGDFTPYTWCSEPSLMNQRVCCFVPLNRRDKAFVRLAIPALLKAEEDTAVATTVIHLGKKDIDTFKVVVPPAPVLDAFGERANPILSKLVAAGLENRTLSVLRDTLLPRLMSGELRVGEAMDQIEGAA